MKSFTKIILLLIILVIAITVIQTSFNMQSNRNNQSFNQTEQSGVAVVKDVAMLSLDGKNVILVTFQLPTPCHNVTLKSTEIKKNIVNLFFKLKTPEKPCIQVVKQYNQTVIVGKLKGEYTLNIFVNEKRVWSREFEI